ncbi:MAG: hypothetical protein A2X08_01000 [Bacteroidetes bacterium GWA2_32_17]|nr:MAG: hypothetical protein A2X08_01000 [Bacteroidetes bacterium GWA2_32_17]
MVKILISLLILFFFCPVNTIFSQQIRFNTNSIKLPDGFSDSINTNKKNFNEKIISAKNANNYIYRIQNKSFVNFIQQNCRDLLNVDKIYYIGDFKYSDKFYSSLFLTLNIGCYIKKIYLFNYNDTNLLSVKELSIDAKGEFGFYTYSMIKHNGIIKYYNSSSDLIQPWQIERIFYPQNYKKFKITNEGYIKEK